MSRINSKRRKFQIKQSQKRAKALAKLRILYQKAVTEKEKEEILLKVAKISPWLSPKEFVESIGKTGN